ncbi:hypothetical protein pb186bvf_004329 [Paramecium bursaria]
MAQALKYHLLELEGLINHRAKGLLNNCPKFLHQKYCHIFFESKSLLEKIRCVDQPLLVLYLINLFISCTRPWEGYDKDERGQPLFFDDPDECIVTSFDLIKKTIETPPQIEVFNNEQILKKAQKKFKIHKIILLKICLQQITDQMLEIFFQHNKILVFKESQQNQSCLQGLSSYDGSFTYIMMTQLAPYYMNTLIIYFVLSDKIANFLCCPQNLMILNIYNQFSGKYEQCESGQYFDRNAEIKVYFRNISPFDLQLINPQ